MSLHGEHPHSISEKNLNYLLSLIHLDVRGSEMTRLAALTIIHQLMTTGDPHGDVKDVFLKNGILEQLLIEFDNGFESEENSVFLNVTLNILLSMSKLGVCGIQPLISDLVIRRLLSVLDVSSSYYTYSSSFTDCVRNLCENKHLIGQVQGQVTSLHTKENIMMSTKGVFKNLQTFPTETYTCLLFDTRDPEHEVNVTDHITSNNLAWPSKKSKDDLDQNTTCENQELWKDILVTEVIYGPYFWAHIGIETIENVRKIQNFLILEHSSGHLINRACAKGDFVVIRQDSDDGMCFFRAQVLSSLGSEVIVWTIDYGFILTVGENQVYTQPKDINLPPQIKLCCIQGIEPKPRDTEMVHLSTAVLCNLTAKSLPCTKIVQNMAGLDIIERLIDKCPDMAVNKELLKLVINLSYAEQNRKWWLETEIIPVLLGKLQDTANKKIFPDILCCLVNLLIRSDEGRAKFYHCQGIDVILKLIITLPCNGEVYKPCIHLLKAFVQRINTPGNEHPEAVQQVTRGQRPQEISKYKFSEDFLRKGEIEYAIPEERLQQPLPCNADGHSPGTTPSVISHLVKDGFYDSERPQDMKEKHQFIIDKLVNIETDASHELRTNKTLSSVSASVVATHVCGMLNNRKGGKIVFGVSAGSKVVGVKAVRDDRDEFRLGVDRMMTDKLSPPVLHSLFDVVYHKVLNDDLDPVPDMFVIIITVKPSKGVLYTLKSGNSSYIRFGSSTSELSIQDLRNLVILEEEDRYRTEIIQLRHRLQELVG